MTRSRMRVSHQVPITSPEMFDAPYSDIPIDRDDPRGQEPLVPLESVGVAFDSYYTKTDGSNPPFNQPIQGSRSVRHGVAAGRLRPNVRKAVESLVALVHRVAHPACPFSRI